MARQKNDPQVVSRKMELAKRVKYLRMMKFGERGGPELARLLGLPIRTWYNYETGVTIPSEVLLDFLQITGFNLDDLFCETLDSLETRQKATQGLTQDYAWQSASHAGGQSHEIENFLAVPSRIIIQVLDDRMTPALPLGSIVAMGKKIQVQQWLDVLDQLVVLWDEDRPIVRRLDFENGTFLLKQNQKQSDFISMTPLEIYADRIYRISWYRIAQPRNQRKRTSNGEIWQKSQQH